MSVYEVDAIEAAVAYADGQFQGAAFADLTDAQIDRRYAEWIVEHLGDAGWRLTRIEPEPMLAPVPWRCEHGHLLHEYCARCSL